MTVTSDPATARGICEGCGGLGHIAAGVQCPVCQGTGVATAADLAAWRQAVVDQALTSVRRQLAASGAAAVTGWLREGAQARQEAQQAALRATQAAEQAQAHARAPHDEAQAVLAEARAVLARAEALAPVLPALPPGAPAVLAPDPTDPPPGIPIAPGFGAGDIFYMDSLLVRQLDVWGSFNAVGGAAGVINPLPAGLGADDAANINTALTAAQLGGPDTQTSQNPGAVVVLGYGLFNLKSQITVPATVSMRGQGNGSRLMCNFTGTAVYHHRPVGYNPQFGAPAQQGLGYLRDFVIDGTNAGPGSVGLDIGDGIGYDVEAVQIINFAATTTFTATAAGVLTLPVGVSLPNGFPVQLQGTALPGTANAGFVYYVTNSVGNTCSLLNAAGGAAVTFSTSGSGTLQCSIGFHLVDYVFWSEKSFGYNLLLQNNAIAALLDTTNPGGGGGDVSLEYNEIKMNIFCNAGQTGVVVAGGANLGGCVLKIYGNMSSLPAALTSAQAGCAVLTFSGQDSGSDSPSRLYQGELHAKVESNPGNGGGLAQVYTVLMATGAEQVEMCAGHIACSTGTSLLNGGEFSFAGMAFADPGLSQVYPSNFVSGTSNNPGTQAGQPTVPPTGKTFFNYAMAMTVYITGGTGGCTVTKSGVAVTVPATVTLPFTVNAREQMVLTYTNAPTWVWVPASYMHG